MAMLFARDTFGSRAGVYVGLNDLQGGPFKAIGGQEAGQDTRYVAKRDTDYEIGTAWWAKAAGPRSSDQVREADGSGMATWHQCQHEHVEDFVLDDARLGDRRTR